MGLLTKEQLLPETPLLTEDVDVPELGGTVRVKKWGGNDGDDYEIYIGNIPNRDGHLVRAAAIAASIVDENGDRIFNMNGDVEKINATWPHSAIKRVHAVIRRMNPTGSEAVEDSEKN